MSWRLGLLGHPVGHSRSPHMHRAALAQAGLSGSYDAIDVPPGQVADTVARLRDDGYRGVNITVPLKTEALEVCDVVEPMASAVGAVNTLVFGEGGVVGANTDVDGLMGTLREVLQFIPRDQAAVVLGAGGAARAAVAGLLAAGAARVVVVNRTVERARLLASELHASAVGLHELDDERPALVINATSVGMSAEPGTRAWAEAEAFFAALPVERWPLQAAVDLIYTPRRTAFLARVEPTGCARCDGLDMLARQGALAFQRWTGVPAGRVLPAMQDALASP